MHDHELEDESLEGMAAESFEADRSFEAPESGPFNESQEMELAARLLEITGEEELDRFLDALIIRASAGRSRRAAPILRVLLRQAAKSALPMITPGDNGAIGSKLTAAAGNLFGLELEGLSPEDQEFEVARRLVRLATAGARNVSRISRRIPPRLAARRGFSAAARRYAPGFLRQRRPWTPIASGVRSGSTWTRRPRYFRSSWTPISRGVSRASAWTRRPRYFRAPVRSAVVPCTNCGAPQPDKAWPAAGDDDATTPSAARDDATSPNGSYADDTSLPAAGDDGATMPSGVRDDATSPDGSYAVNTSLPDQYPANSTDTQSTQTETDMHDLDHTTMEFSGEAADFEFENPFSEDEVEEFASRLLEITNEQELDQCVRDLLRRGGRMAGPAPRPPVLNPLGGFLKSAIRRALPMAGGALGNIVAPGVGGLVGSQIASGAGRLLGLEYEGLAPEDQEFEVAKRLVRMVGTAIQNAADGASITDPTIAAKSAVVSAAEAHVPGLLESYSRRRGSRRRQRSRDIPDYDDDDDDTSEAESSRSGRQRTGRWYRRGRRIILVGA
jgi:hypothetical protein